MMATIMERPTGVGTVYRDDSEIAIVRYTLTIGLANQHDVGGQMTVIDGEWDFTSDDLLTLHLKDGRWFDFVPMDASGKPPALTYKVLAAVDGRGLFALKGGSGSGLTSTHISTNPRHYS